MRRFSKILSATMAVSLLSLSLAGSVQAATLNAGGNNLMKTTNHKLIECFGDRKDAATDSQIAVCFGNEAPIHGQIAVCGGEDASKDSQIAVCFGNEIPIDGQIAVCGGEDGSKDSQIAVCGVEEVPIDSQIAVCY